MPEDRKRAVVLLSGGLDSSTVLAIAQDLGFECSALSFRYGQRHDTEIEASRRIAARAGVQHTVIDLDPTTFAKSALTKSGNVPKHRSATEISTGIPDTYVPARNTIFLSFALGWAECIGASDIFIGVNALDYSGYPDCRPEYIRAFQVMARLATRAGVTGQSSVTIHTPLIDLTKAEIVREGLALGVDFGLTRTCYDPSPAGHACGACDACILRLKGFAENGLPDPAPYQAAASA